MTKKTHFWLKDRCVKFYEEREGDNKVYFATFYHRVRKFPDWDMADLIQRKERKYRKGCQWVFTWAYSNEMKWWYEQVEPKASKQVFYWRIRIGYTKEQAILTGDKWLAVLEAKPIKKKSGYKCYTLTKQDIEQKEEDYTWIDITLSKEEAQVFRKEFLKVISDLEWELMQLEEKTLIKETNEKLELVKAELNIFNNYNPQ